MNPVRQAWVDIAKGLSIMLVVMMYATYNTGQHTGGTGFMHYAIAFATPFRMPEFFVISGLFLSRVIGRPWTAFADRRVVHYLYFYAVWAALLIVLKFGVFLRDPGAMITELAQALVQPYGVLWFVYLLAVFGIVAKLLWRIQAPHWAVLAFSALLVLAPMQSPSYIVTQFCAYFFYFYLGYVFAPQILRLADWAEQNRPAAWAGLSGFVLLNAVLVFLPHFELLPSRTIMGYAQFPPIHLGLAVSGALALYVLSALLARYPAAWWLEWIGRHSLVIYLAFTIPMSLFRTTAMSTGLITDTGILGLSVFVAAMIGPVILYKMIEFLGRGWFLFERPGWAHIAGSDNSTPIGKSPDAS